MATFQPIAEELDQALSALYKRMGWASIDLKDRRKLANAYSKLLALRIRVLRVQLADFPGEVEDAVAALKAVTKTAKDQSDKITRNTELVSKIADVITLLSSVLLLI